MNTGGPLSIGSSDAVSRLGRLELYLRQDPDNPPLLADAFEAALEAGETDRAARHLEHAQALGLDRPSWRRREAHLELAQHRWDAARELLVASRDEVSQGSVAAAAIAADLAWVELCTGNFATGVALLEPLLGSGAERSTPGPAVETLWLRLLHRSSELERAMQWLRDQEEARTLPPDVAGVASLIALDLGEYASSLCWSELAMLQAEPVIEARVARASLALGERDATFAIQLLRPALGRHHGDGRVWSTIGFAHLLESDWASAHDAFSRAVRLLPDHVGTWHGLAWTMIAQRELADAQRAFDIALALDRNFAESHGGVAVVAALQGDLTRARKAIDVALRLDRKSLAAQYAEALLAGEAVDVAGVGRVAERLFGTRAGPLGSSMMDLLRKSAKPGAPS